MIDLHILNHAPSTRPDWWEACLTSAKAAESAGWVTLHVVDATGDSIGTNRAAAFRLGNHPFVACLDNDDILLPEALPVLLQALADHPAVCGVYSDRMQIDESGKVLFTMRRSHWTPEAQLRSRQDYPHMLAVYRRAAVLPHLDTIATFKNYSEFVLAGLVTQFGPWRHVPVVAYQRREKDYYVNHVRPIAPDLAHRARALVEPILMNRLHSNR